MLLPELPAISSSRVREALLAEDDDVLKHMLQPQVLDWCRERSSCREYTGDDPDELWEEFCRELQSRLEVSQRALDRERAQASEERQALLQDFERQHEDAKREAERLAQDLRHERLQLAELQGRVLCVICMAAERSVALQPCFHLVSCSGCFQHLNECPVCRSAIRGNLSITLA